VEMDVTELVVDKFQSERGCFFDHLELIAMPEEAPSKQLTIPSTTYRLQLSSKFTFNDADRAVDYFAKLGVSHLYLSPILEARPGSPHGYDIINHRRLNPELGSQLDFNRLSEHLRA